MLEFATDLTLPYTLSNYNIYYRYRRSDGRSPASAPCEGEDSPDSPTEESSRLQDFFERLGLEPRQYDALVRDALPDSPVFFSSASTVDSNQLAAVADYTVTFNPVICRHETSELHQGLIAQSRIRERIRSLSPTW